MYIDKDGGAQCVADNEDDEREILPYPGTKSKSGDMEILRILQKSSQSADGTKLKLCQEQFANSAGERTPIKAYIDSTLCCPWLEVWKNAIHATIESSETYTNYKEKREDI